MRVKTIGDALMLRTDDAAAAIRLGLCIVHDVGAQHGFPLVRVGMHTGSAVERDSDWFGATVNLAARVSAAASGGEALLTAATRTAAGQVAGVELRARGRWTRAAGCCWTTWRPRHGPRAIQWLLERVTVPLGASTCGADHCCRRRPGASRSNDENDPSPGPSRGWPHANPPSPPNLSDTA